MDGCRRTVLIVSGSNYRSSKRQVEAAEDAYLAGARLLDHNDLTGAELQFGKAAKLDPGNSDYASAYTVIHQRHVSQLVQESGKARLLGQNEKAETPRRGPPPRSREQNRWSER